MLRIRSVIVFGALVIGGTLGTTLEAQGASRVITRAQLPPIFQRQLPRGEIARVSPHCIDTVAAASQVTLRAGELLAVRTGAKATAIARPAAAGPSSGTDSAYRLPFTYLGLDREGATAATYRPVFVTAGPLRYLDTADVFEGTFLLGLQDSASPTATREITAPVRMRFAGDADSITPDSVVLRQTNTQMEKIRVYSQGSVDSLRVLIVPPFDPQGVDVWLPIRPALAFEQRPGAIQGLGVEDATLVISTRGTRSPDTTRVTLSASKGSLDHNLVSVAQAGAVVKLRSAGLGHATINATAPGWSAARIRVRYRFPYEFLGAALLGGLLGGLVAYLYAKRRTAASLRQYLLKGVVAGLLTCVVYFGLGITLVQFNVQIQFFNELAVFALAALAGAFGITLLALGTGRGARG
jgi:hypothetical protein